MYFSPALSSLTIDGHFNLWFTLFLSLWQCLGNASCVIIMYLLYVHCKRESNWCPLLEQQGHQFESSWPNLHQSRNIRFNVYSGVPLCYVYLWISCIFLPSLWIPTLTFLNNDINWPWDRGTSSDSSFISMGMDSGKPHGQKVALRRCNKQKSILIKLSFATQRVLVPFRRSRTALQKNLTSTFRQSCSEQQEKHFVLIIEFQVWRPTVWNHN